MTYTNDTEPIIKVENVIKKFYAGDKDVTKQIACPKQDKTAAKAIKAEKIKAASRPHITIDPALLDLYKAVDTRG